jgi:thiosulfate dehydrogenase (quinone) large subunit
VIEATVLGVLFSFFESIKYVGHLFPIALLRVYLGYFYMDWGFQSLKTFDVTQPVLREKVVGWLPLSQAPGWNLQIVKNWILPNWESFAYFFSISHMVIGVGFLIGMVVRPLSVLGVLLSLQFFWMMGPDTHVLYKTFIAIHFTIGWLGAGRCLGFDYFFYKRHRGIWW